MAFVWKVILELFRMEALKMLDIIFYYNLINAKSFKPCSNLYAY